MSQAWRMFIGAIFIIVMVNAVMILGISLWSNHPSEMEALDTGGTFLDAVEQKQMEQAWDMLAPEVQAQLNQATFLRSQGDLAAVIQEFRNAGITLGAGNGNGRDYRSIGIQPHQTTLRPDTAKIVVTYSGDHVVISNLWDGSQP